MMHRTESLDYGVVLEGSMELILDSGETKIMNRGDVCVQRATSHAWKNVSENGGWARMLVSDSILLGLAGPFFVEGGGKTRIRGS
jgi:quercetin dioxygenase-like cupin family protein